MNYKTLVDEKESLERQIRPLRWIQRCLKGNPVGDETVVLSVKQSTGTQYIGIDGELMMQNAIPMLKIVDNNIVFVEERIAKIDAIISEVDKLVGELDSSK